MVMYDDETKQWKIKFEPTRKLNRKRFWVSLVFKKQFVIRTRKQSFNFNYSDFQAACILIFFTCCEVYISCLQTIKQNDGRVGTIGQFFRYRTLPSRLINSLNTDHLPGWRRWQWGRGAGVDLKAWRIQEFFLLKGSKTRE